MTTRAEHWHERAQHSRVLAELMSDEHARAAMLWVADAYEEMAEDAETRDRRADPLRNISPATAPVLSD